MYVEKVVDLNEVMCRSCQLKEAVANHETKHFTGGESSIA